MTPRQKVPVTPGVRLAKTVPSGEWLCTGCGKHLRPCLCGFISCTKIPRHIQSGRVECDPADMEKELADDAT